MHYIYNTVRVSIWEITKKQAVCGAESVIIEIMAGKLYPVMVCNGLFMV